MMKIFVALTVLATLAFASQYDHCYIECHDLGRSIQMNMDAVAWECKLNNPNQMQWKHICNSQYQVCEEHCRFKKL